MTKVRRAAFVPFSATQMFDVVNDVESYPEFLPWCEAAAILIDEPQRMQARLTINKGRFRYSFTTSNQYERGRSIRIGLVDGPFRKFTGAWRFDDVDGGCMVHFELEFEFSNRLLAVALNAVFKPIADSQVDAFKRRAHEIYTV